MKGESELVKGRDAEAKLDVGCGLSFFANGLVDWRVDGEDEMAELVDAPVGIMD